MAIKTIDDTNLTNIAEAIRAKNGTTNVYKPSEMAAAIQAITTGGGSGGGTPTDLYINANGGTTSGPDLYTALDTTNATTLSFKYDYNMYSSSNTSNPFTIKVYLGWGIVLSASSKQYTYGKVDEGNTTKTVASSISTNVSGVEVSVDVSAYTSVLIFTDYSGKVANAKASAHLYDIKLS